MNRHLKQRSRARFLQGTCVQCHLHWDPILLTDLEHLRWLSIAHYVLACFAILGGCCGFLYLGAGAAVMFVPPPVKIPNQPPAPTSAPNQQPPPANVPSQPLPPPPPQFMAPLMGGMFAFLGVAIMILAWTMGAALFLSGRWLAEHRNWTFCLVVACLGMLNQPPRDDPRHLHAHRLAATIGERVISWAVCNVTAIRAPLNDRPRRQPVRHLSPGVSAELPVAGRNRVLSRFPRRGCAALFSPLPRPDRGVWFCWCAIGFMFSHFFVRATSGCTPFPFRDL